MADEVSEDTDEILSEFLTWCDINGLILSKKVKVGLRGSCHRYGMIATDDIKKGECLFEIPRSLLLQPKTSSISGILGNLTDEDQLVSERGSGWAPLLLTLMYEYTNSTSRWKPYLNLVRDVTVLDQPMFWGEDERQRELKGTGIEEDVESDIQHIEEEYNTIVLPFIKKHQQYFSECLHTLYLYRHMAAFVMAYSFTEQSPNNDDDDDDNDDDDTAPAMVPMADILNHISNNNAHLEFGAKTLSMVATQHICKGQEIFNTYGKLANCHLLQSYGFVEDELPNPYDMVDIPISALCEVIKASQSSKATQLLNAKFEFMEEMGVASEDDVFLFGREGCSHFGPDLYATLRILHLSEVKFRQLLEEQIQKQRSKEFDDISHALNQHDEETKKDTSWKILELVFNAEQKRDKKKRGIEDEKSKEKNKKFKKVQNDKKLGVEDCNLGAISVNDSFSNSYSDGVALCLNGYLETGNIKSDKNPSAGKAVCSPIVDGKLIETKTKDESKCVKQDFVQGGVETCDRERSKNGVVTEGDSRDCDGDIGDDEGDGDSEEIEDNVEDDDDDDDVDDDDDDDDDDYVNVDDYDDDDDDDEEEEEEEEEEGDEEEESEQPLTYNLLSQWPIEWRKTLQSAAELCIKKRYGEDKMDEEEDKNLSKRQLSVLRIKRGQRSIYQRICELVVEN